MKHNAKFLLAAVLFLGLVSAFDQPGGTKLWDFYGGQPVQSSPALGADGTVVFGADNGKVYAFDAQGNGKWEFETRDAVVASPALAPDGTVVVGSSARPRSARALGVFRLDAKDALRRER